MSQPDPGGLHDKTSATDKFKDRIGASQTSMPAAMEERELWHGTFSSKAMMGHWFMAAVVSVVLIALGIYLVAATEYEWNMYALYGALGVAVLWFLGTWLVLVYRQWSRHYQVTTQRIVHQEGILRRTNDRLEIIDVSDVSFTQTIFDRMFGVGDIKVVSNDQSHPILILEGIADVARVTNIIDDARRACCRGHSRAAGSGRGELVRRNLAPPRRARYSRAIHCGMKPVRQAPTCWLGVSV
jgi:membrane protein YdbS with pleckstrin-like domain